MWSVSQAGPPVGTDQGVKIVFVHGRVDALFARELVVLRKGIQIFLRRQRTFLLAFKKCPARSRASPFLDFSR